MRRLAFATALLTCVAVSAGRAQELIGEYLAWLGPADFFTSLGTPLDDFGAILRQDRANFHRHGHRDALDQADPVFDDPWSRARIPRMLTTAPGAEDLPERVVSGRTRHVLVRIYGEGSVPRFILVSDGGG